jgi:hypothetical protein
MIRPYHGGVSVEGTSSDRVHLGLSYTNFSSCIVAEEGAAVYHNFPGLSGCPASEFGSGRELAYEFINIVDCNAMSSGVFYGLGDFDAPWKDETLIKNMNVVDTRARYLFWQGGVKGFVRFGFFRNAEPPSAYKIDLWSHFQTTAPGLWHVELISCGFIGMGVPETTNGLSVVEGGAEAVATIAIPIDNAVCPTASPTETDFESPIETPTLSNEFKLTALGDPTVNVCVAPTNGIKLTTFGDATNEVGTSGPAVSGEVVPAIGGFDVTAGPATRIQAASGAAPAQSDIAATVGLWKISLGVDGSRSSRNAGLAGSSTRDVGSSSGDGGLASWIWPVVAASAVIAIIIAIVVVVPIVRRRAAREESSISDVGIPGEAVTASSATSEFTFGLSTNGAVAYSTFGRSALECNSLAPDDDGAWEVV